MTENNLPTKLARQTGMSRTEAANIIGTAYAPDIKDLSQDPEPQYGARTRGGKA